jgi:calcineurin-like phosphoesterase family protein
MFATDMQQLLSKINENSFLISDTHFFHDNVTTFEPSRLESMHSQGFGLDPECTLIEAHKNWLIYNWNSVVQDDDIVIHLGDFAWRGMQEVIKELNGIKILILGNHDRKGLQVYRDFHHVVRGSNILINNKLYIAESNDALLSSLELIIRKKKLLLSHYPAHADEHRYRVDNETGEKLWQGPINSRIDEMIIIGIDNDIDLNIHGHTHSKCYRTGYTWNFYNVSLENIDFKPKRLGDILDEVYEKDC